MGGGGRRPLTEPYPPLGGWGSGRGRRPLTIAHDLALARLGYGEGAQAPRKERANEGPLTGYGVADPGKGPRRSQCRRSSRPHSPPGEWGWGEGGDIGGGPLACWTVAEPSRLLVQQPNGL